MKIGVFLNFVGLGSNLLHLSYCHQIAKKYGPINIITQCNKLKEALEDDPLINEIIIFEKKKKTIINIFYLSNFLRKLNLDKLFIYYPGKRIYLAARISGIKEIMYYKNLKKKNLHLVEAAKDFTTKCLNLDSCPSETDFFISDKNKQIGKKLIQKDKFNIVLGVGSSGPTTKWGIKNYSDLINKLNLIGNFYFYLLCGKQEIEIPNLILSKLINKNCLSLHDMSIKQLIPILAHCNMYVGNDSFGHHITSQLKIPSIVIMLDTPKAYTDYSVNQFRILPEGISIDEIDHDSNFKPNQISVEKVINKILELKKLN
tara:strand:+ start:406 stop:1350 length:945 start_codon:yes stop_codon:yes gene_type:complete